MHTFCSSLTEFSSTKSVQTRFVAPQKPLIDTFLEDLGSHLFGGFGQVWAKLGLQKSHDCTIVQLQTKDQLTSTMGISMMLPAGENSNCTIVQLQTKDLHITKG